MSRREFAAGLGAASFAALLPPATLRLAEAASLAPPAALLPRALEPGMSVALVAPSSHLFEPERYRIAEDVVRSLGLVPRLAAHATDQRGYLAGTDADRAADLNLAFSDPAVDAVWCLRGGYGALRILPLLDFEQVRAHPKVFLGYSDITALHAALGKLTGLVTFHAPMPAGGIPEYALAELRRVVFTRAPAGIVGAPPAFEPAPGRVERAHRPVTIRGGRAKGRLVGGNLTLVTRLVGTPFEPAFEGAVLFLEDTGEATYRIDGMVSQLRLSGRLSKCAAIVFGKFTEDGGGDQPVRLPTETVLRELTSDLGIPVYSGLLSGHLAEQTTIPCGVLAEVDADACTLKVLDPAVS